MATGMAVSEGDSLGPSYGSVEAAQGSAVLANGVRPIPRLEEAEAPVGPSDSLRRSFLDAAGRISSELREQPTGSGETPFLTGLGATTTNVVGGEARGTYSPEAPLRLVETSQPQQPPFPQPHRSLEQDLQQQYSQPQQQQEQAFPTGDGHMRSQSTSPVPSPSQYPDPRQLPPPAQALRAWTTQVASAAAVVTQRMQLQACLGQGHVAVHTGEVFGPGYGTPGVNVEGQGAGFPIHGDPPPLPAHLQAEAGHDQTRSGVFAGLARAGQALRRRVVEPVLQHVSRTSQAQAPHPYAAGDAVHGEGNMTPHRGVLPPTVAEAMQEWTSRPSLLAPQPLMQPSAKDESSASSLSPERVMEEVKRQVQLAMADKDVELRELRQQNALLMRAVQASTRVAGRDEGQERGASMEGLRGGAGGEPASNPAAWLPCAHVSREDPGPVYGSAGISSGNPPGAGERRKEPVGELGGPLDRGVHDGRRLDSGSQVPEGQFGPTQIGSANVGTGGDEPLHLLVQGMRQLQQAYLGKNDSKDVEFKGVVEIPPMPDVGAEASVAFADWLYELEQAVGGLSDKASVWFAACLEVAGQTYLEYTMASPLTRLSLKPRIPESLKDPKWARLERRVMTLLLGAMKRPAKEDAITHRITDVTSLLFRLHVLYQPGGTSERASVLKHLEGKLGSEDIHECVTALRKWRRYLDRAESMHVTVPDPSILLGAVELIAKKVMGQYPEVKFRTDLMKNELQLQGRPTLDGVLRLHNHILAELQMIAPVASSSTSTSLKAIGTGQAGTGEASTPSGSPSRRSAGKPPCKYFLSKTGCSRGSNCKYVSMRLSPGKTRSHGVGNVVAKAIERENAP